MDHVTPLIATIVIGIGLAFILGTIANRLRISPIIGYLLAGIAVGPFTPGFVADQDLAMQLAELGVILLMFGVGLHFSFKDLLSVAHIAVPGAVTQITIATFLGLGMASFVGWGMGAGIVFGLALSVASTIVLLRALQEHRLLETERGHIAVGWLVVEDIAMVLALVLLPAIAPLLAGTAADPAGERNLLEVVLFTFGKVGAFVAATLLIGQRIVPWLLHYVAHTGSRELFRLAVLSIALGAAYAAVELFGVSFALGAFFAGVMLSESALSQRAAEETLPLRDAFAVLFFVSVGMLFDPWIISEQFLLVIATLFIILIGKSCAALLIVLAFRYPLRTALLISASLAQIGEFSFILAALGVGLGLLSEEGRDLILAGALLSILLNPLAFHSIGWINDALERRIPGIAKYGKEAKEKPITETEGTIEREPALQKTGLTGHSVLVGYGRVGHIVGADLQARREPFLVIEDSEKKMAALKASGIEIVPGNAVESMVLTAANIHGAKRLFIAIPNTFEAGQIVEQARAMNPALAIIARAHTRDEANYLSKLGATTVIIGEHEIAHGMINVAFESTTQPAAP